MESVRACNELSICLKSPSNLLPFREAGGQLTLLILLRQHRDRQGVAATIVECLVRSSGEQPPAAGEDAWPAELLGPAARAAVDVLLLYPHHVELQHHGCTLLSRLSHSNAGCDAVADAGARAAVTAALKRYGSTVAQIECPCLHILSKLSQPWAHMPAVVLHHHSSPRLQAEAGLILASEAVELAVQALGRVASASSSAPAPNTPLVALGACQLLLNVSTTPGGRDRLLGSDAVIVLIAFLSGTVDVRAAHPHESAAASAHVAAPGGSRLKDMLGAVGAAVFALGSLAASDAAVARRLAAAGAIECVIRVIEAGAQREARAATAACLAVAAFLRCSDLVPQCIAGGAIRMAAAALQMHHNDATAAGAAAEALLLCLGSHSVIAASAGAGATVSPVGLLASAVRFATASAAAASAAAGPTLEPAAVAEAWRAMVEAGVMEGAVAAVRALAEAPAPVAASAGASDAARPADAVVPLARLLELLSCGDLPGTLNDSERGSVSLRAVSAGAIEALAALLSSPPTLCPTGSPAERAAIYLFWRICECAPTADSVCARLATVPSGPTALARAIEAMRYDSGAVARLHAILSDLLSGRHGDAAAARCAQVARMPQLTMTLHDSLQRAVAVFKNAALHGFSVVDDEELMAIDVGGCLHERHAASCVHRVMQLMASICCSGVSSAKPAAESWTRLVAWLWVQTVAGAVRAFSESHSDAESPAVVVAGMEALDAIAGSAGPRGLSELATVGHDVVGIALRVLQTSLATESADVASPVPSALSLLLRMLCWRSSLFAVSVDGRPAFQQAAQCALTVLQAGLAGSHGVVCASALLAELFSREWPAAHVATNTAGSDAEALVAAAGEQSGGCPIDPHAALTAVLAALRRSPSAVVTNEMFVARTHIFRAVSAIVDRCYVSDCPTDHGPLLWEISVHTNVVLPASAENLKQPHGVSCAEAAAAAAYALRSIAALPCCREELVRTEMLPSVLTAFGALCAVGDAAMSAACGDTAVVTAGAGHEHGPDTLAFAVEIAAAARSIAFATFGIVRNLCASPELRCAVAATPGIVASLWQAHAQYWSPLTVFGGDSISAASGDGRLHPLDGTLLCHDSAAGSGSALSASERSPSRHDFTHAMLGALFGLACEPDNCPALLAADVDVPHMLRLLCREVSDAEGAAYFPLADPRVAWAACGLLLKLAKAASSRGAGAADAAVAAQPGNAAPVASASTGSAVGCGAGSPAAESDAAAAPPAAAPCLDAPAGWLQQLAAVLRLHGDDARVARAARGAIAVLASSPAACSALATRPAESIAAAL